MDSNNELKIPLPDTFTRNIMPADRSHIPTPEVANAWPYLKPIASEIMPLQNCEIGLLIGYNWLQLCESPNTPGRNSTR